MATKKMGMNKAGPPKLSQFPAAKQRRLDQLLEKNREGTLAPKEQALLQQLVIEAEELMVANARRLADFAQRQARPAATNAIPVTVWVHPQAEDR